MSQSQTKLSHSCQCRMISFSSGCIRMRYYYGAICCWSYRSDLQIPQPSWQPCSTRFQKSSYLACHDLQKASTCTVGSQNWQQAIRKYTVRAHPVQRLGAEQHAAYLHAFGSAMIGKLFCLGPVQAVFYVLPSSVLFLKTGIFCGFRLELSWQACPLTCSRLFCRVPACAEPSIVDIT